jgi:parallel beta-helix repeat protein
MRWMLILSGLIVLFSFSISYATDISSCQTLSSTDTYTLTQNVASGNTCFNMSADGVVLNCQGYTINYSQSASGHGILFTSGIDSVTIKNCIIEQGGTSSSSNGIFLDHNTNSYNVIHNNTIRTYGSGSETIHIDGGDYNNITSNNLSTQGTSLANIDLDDGADNNIIESNVINSSTTSIGNIVGINLETVDAASNIIRFNTIFLSDAGSGQNPGINVEDANNIIHNNNITSGSEGIYLENSWADNNEVFNNTVTANRSYAMAVHASASGNSIYNNFFNGTKGSINMEGTLANIWNTTQESDTDIVNIMGSNQIGGNFYANSTHNGFSQTCTDADEDGICDSSYTLATNNIDYLPLSTTIYLLTEGPAELLTLLLREDAYGIEYNSSVLTGNINGIRTNTSITSGWHHISLTYNKDGGTNNLKIYIDGILSTSATITGAINGNNNDIIIGQRFENGIIDEVRISNYSRDFNTTIAVNVSHPNVKFVRLFNSTGQVNQSTDQSGASTYYTEYENLKTYNDFRVEVEDTSQNIIDKWYPYQSGGSCIPVSSVDKIRFSSLNCPSVTDSYSGSDIHLQSCV